MDWFYAAIVITGFATLIAILWAQDDGYYSKGTIVAQVFFGFAAATGVIAVILNAACMNANYKGGQRDSFVTDIVNLHDSSATEGSGGLFYFVVETYPRFTYYVQNSDGSFSPDYVDDDYNHRVRIFEDGQANPRLDCMTDYVVKGHNDDLSIWGPHVDSNSCHDYVFHVPPGSVSRQYALGGSTDSGGGK